MRKTGVILALIGSVIGMVFQITSFAGLAYGSPDSATHTVMNTFPLMELLTMLSLGVGMLLNLTVIVGAVMSLTDDRGGAGVVQISLKLSVALAVIMSLITGFYVTLHSEWAPTPMEFKGAFIGGLIGGVAGNLIWILIVLHFMKPKVARSVMDYL